MGRFMKVGILGAGRIAATLAETMNKMPEVECYGVASRNLEKAEVFAKDHGFQHAFGSYEDMLADQEVKLIYIATPHSHHYQHIKMCLNAGKHVLCEKSFTVNEKQAAVAELADAPDLGSGEVTREGSSPFARTIQNASSQVWLLFISNKRNLVLFWKANGFSLVLYESAL